MSRGVMRVISFFIYILLSCFACGYANPVLLDQSDQLNALAPTAPHLVINNRPLVKINGKVISLIDVVKKMDILIHEHYPQITQSIVSLFQFYDNQWKAILEDMVFNELMILDAEQKEIKVSDGDVREEMERRFGPNIISTLSKLKLQYDEVKQMVRDEIIVRRIQGYKVYSKVQLTVTPEVIKSAYLKYLEENPPKEEWKYQVLSVRGSDAHDCLSIVNSISEKLKLTNTKLSDIVEETSKDIAHNGIKLNISEDYIVNNTKLSKENRSILESLKEGEYSLPIKQISRVDNTTVYRIFHLKAHMLETPKTLNDMYDSIYNKLLDFHAKNERSKYLKRLGRKFGFDEDIITETISSHYQPFALK